MAALGPLLGSFRDFGGGEETPETLCIRFSARFSGLSSTFEETKTGRDSWGRVISRARGAFSPQRGVKSHFPRSWRILRRPTSDSRSRSPLSIRALRSARNARIRLVTNIVSKLTDIFPVQSCPLARLVQDDGSRTLPQNNTIYRLFLATYKPRS